MYGVSPFILILITLFFQLIYGRKAINKTISLSFGAVSLISITSQVILSIVAYFVASYNFIESLEGEYHCGMGMLGIIMISFVIFMMLLMLIIVQHLTRKNYQ